MSRPAGGLPVWPTPLLGREDEIATAGRLLRGAPVRLLTLTGPGGVGKTRVAAQVTAELREDFPDGAPFVSLAPLSQPAAVVDALADALDIAERGRGDPLERVVRQLSGRHVLVVLDNFEHLLAAAPTIAELIARCPPLKILVTSRVRLELQAERELPITPLPVPDPTGDLSVEALGACPSVRLFVERADAVRPGLALSDENASSVAQVCVRLDGLPLAIELAAAQVKLLPPAALLGRLERGVALLRGGPRDLPARQRALTDTIAWSYELLGVEERRLLERLAVFAGGCTLEAAEAVCSAAPGDGEVIEPLRRLVNASLVYVDETPRGSRFMMLETIREYALERLAERGDEQVRVRDAHARYYRDRAAEVGAGLAAFEHGPAIGEFAAELGNVRAALRWLLPHDSQGALELAASLWRLWLFRGRLSEGRGWLEAALGRPGPATATRAQALAGASVLASFLNDFASAAAHSEQSIRLSRELGDTSVLESALMARGAVARATGDAALARSLHEEALQVSRALGHQGRLAFALSELAFALWIAGDYADARPLLDESLALARELQSDRLTASALLGLGSTVLGLGDADAALAPLADAVELFSALADPWNAALARLRVGWAALELRDTAGARSLFEEAFVAFSGLEDTWLSEACLVGLALVAAVDASPVDAARLLGCAGQIDDTEAVRPAFVDERYRRALTDARERLGEDDFQRVFAEGRAMTPSEAFKETQASSRRRPSSELTPREIEVLRLVAFDLTDADVAARLVVSIRTVHAHLRSIYRKLGVSSRRAASRRAAEHGLV